jgi:hypothetical protein
MITRLSIESVTGALGNDPFGSRPEPGPCLIAYILLLRPGEVPKVRSRGTFHNVHSLRTQPAKGINVGGRNPPWGNCLGGRGRLGLDHLLLGKASPSRRQRPGKRMGPSRLGYNRPRSKRKAWVEGPSGNRTLRFPPRLLFPQPISPRPKNAWVGQDRPDSIRTRIPPISA